VYGNEIPIPMGIPLEWENKYAKMGTRKGRVHMTMGTGMATFPCVPKFTLVERVFSAAGHLLEIAVRTS